MDAQLAELTTSPEHAATLARIRAGHLTHTAMEDAAGTRMGFLRLTKGGQTSTNTDHVFVELSHERLCRLRPTAVSGIVDALREAFVDRKLEVSLHAASKVGIGAASTTYIHYQPPGPNAKA
jgi:hypothetical protein